MKWKKGRERKVPVLVYINPETLQEIESIIECLNVSRSAFVEHLIQHGLEAVKTPKNTGVV